MITVFIVDADSDGLSRGLNTIAKRDKLDLLFQAYLTPEEMFRDMKKSIPDLIVLHHNWSGITVSNLLERITTETGGTTRVIVFTGQSVKLNELIECVRLGVADYWTKNTYDPTTALRQISHYCASSVWTIDKLRTSSGSLRQLLERVESSDQQGKHREQQNSELRGRVEALESQERKHFLDVLFGLLKIIVIVVALTAAFVVINKYTPLETWGGLSFVAIIAVCFLLSEGRITSAWVRWTGGAAGVNAREPTSKARSKKVGAGGA